MSAQRTSTSDAGSHPWDYWPSTKGNCTTDSFSTSTRTYDESQLFVWQNKKNKKKKITNTHSHRDKIPDNDRLTYARECNRYVRQKDKLKLNLKSRALAMFTSDDEKEAFLKEFKYNKELVEFYVCRGRIKEALLHAVTSGDFDDALEGMIERGRDNSEVVMVVKGVEKEDMRLEDVFNYAQTKRMLANMSGKRKSLSLDYNGRHEGIEWGRKWEEFVAVAGEYIMSGMELERGCIEEEWIREYLDTIVRKWPFSFFFITVTVTYR